MNDPEGFQIDAATGSSTAAPDPKRITKQLRQEILELEDDTENLPDEDTDDERWAYQHLADLPLGAYRRAEAVGIVQDRLSAVRGVVSVRDLAVFAVDALLDSGFVLARMEVG